MTDDIGASRGAEQKIQLLQEMRGKNFDVIRFASYRTACKLRFIQKKTHLHMIDIWNVIEAFRENGLNTLDAQTEVNVSRLELLVSSLYHNLNKRLPVSQQVNVESLSSLLLNWLLSAYAVETLRRIRVFSIKVALATMCAGKLMDKLRYLFSQLCDGNGHLIAWKLSEFLQQVLALPAAVYESPSFSYCDQLATNIFSGMSKVTVNDFMDTMMSDPGPSCLVWLPLLHRLAGIENVVHPTVCDGCQKENFTGFRYRCMKCHNYQMCQECFWHGRVNGSHTIEHEVKEYTSYKSPSRQIGHTLRKSFRCVPEKGKANIPRFPDEPEKTINLSHIVPPSPLPSHNGFADYDVSSMDSRSIARSPRYTSSLESTKLDDEHKLIARYAARLAVEARSVGRTPSEGSLSLDTSRAQRELIQQLEAKNREIMREIARLRRQQELEGSNCLDGDPELVNELKELRQRKDDLERHLSALQDSRRHLMIQLESLMKLLKNQQPSPRSTPNSSPRATKSPPPSRSAPPTPVLVNTNAAVDALTNDMRSVFGATSTIGASSSSLASLSGGGGQSTNNHTPDGRSLRNDLLVAADSVTNAMSSLVRELNSEGSEDDHSVESVIQKPLELESEKKNNRDKLCPRIEQDPKFLAELKAATQLHSSKNTGELVNGNGPKSKKEADGHSNEIKKENWDQGSDDEDLNDLR